MILNYFKNTMRGLLDSPCTNVRNKKVDEQDSMNKVRNPIF